jgi:hypothetical protein
MLYFIILCFFGVAIYTFFRTCDQIEMLYEDYMFFFPRKKIVHKKNVATNYKNNDGTEIT